MLGDASSPLTSCPFRFPARLVVDEDDKNLVMDFQLDPEGGASGEVCGRLCLGGLQACAGGTAQAPANECGTMLGGPRLQLMNMCFS